MGESLQGLSRRPVEKRKRKATVYMLQQQQPC